MAKVTTGALVGRVSGRLGGLVFVRQRDGSMAVREYTVPRDPQTAAQLEWRSKRKRASAAFNQLSEAQYAHWQQYALSQTAVNVQTGIPKTPQAYNLYVTLAAKLLQAVPNATLPMVPPTQDFVGDGIVVTATAEAGDIKFTASGANAAHVVTELLVQPIASRNRKPVLRSYRPQAFVAFTSNGLSQTVTAQGEWFACAVRFVHNQTGQASAIIELGKVQVGVVG